MLRPEDIRGRLFPAVPTPLDADGEVHLDGLARLIAMLRGQGIGGVAAGTSIGRGSRLSSRSRSLVMGAWREGLGGGLRLIAWAGAGPEVRRPSEMIEAASAMASQAARSGADAILVGPPGAVRGRPDRDRLVLEYHAEVAGAGLPLLISYRKESSGGVAYGPEVLAQLLARPEVLGVEIATIDGIATFQQVTALAREQAPDKIVVSGEERFLGYSLMCGTQAAMVGLGAAFPEEVAGLIEAHTTGDASRFLKLSAVVDALGRRIYSAPMEGAVLRLLWSLVHLGVLPTDASHDPWGPRLGKAELARFRQVSSPVDQGDGAGQ